MLVMSKPCYLAAGSVALFASLQHAAASCEPPVAFLTPEICADSINSTLSRIGSTLNDYFSSDEFATSSCSVQITSAEGTIWSKHHTANSTGRGTLPVNGSTVYRIASNTKLFTALAVLQQHGVGKIDLDNSITRYVSGLESSGAGGVEWERISVRALLSQSGGIKDNYAEEDLLAIGGAAALGLPAVSQSTADALPACEISSSIPCTEAGLIDDLSQSSPLFPPHSQSTYSNVGFDLLGLAIENITGMTYEAYVESHILKPLGLDSTTFETPLRSTGAIPAGESQWGDDLAVGNAAGGLYSSSDDMARFYRYALKHYHSISPTINWFSPLAYSTGSHSLFGAPWEIFRTTSVLPDTNRPVTFVTKGGGLDGYYSYSVLMPDYNLAVSILLAGPLGGLEPLLGKITTPLVRAAESLAQSDLERNYAGSYAAARLNSSLELVQSTTRSLYVASWLSNGTEVLGPLTQFVAAQAGQGSDIYFQVVPTFESRQDGNRTGEVWRFINALNTPAVANTSSSIWNDYCVANLDPITYAGKPLNEVVFWKKGAQTDEIELPAFRVAMGRV